MISKLSKYWLFILASIWSLSFFIAYQTEFNTDYSVEVDRFQAKFTLLEKRMDSFLDDKIETLLNQGITELQSTIDNPSFNLHVYRNDSLVFWNSNLLPVSRFVDIHYPASGIVHLQNGWYYAKSVNLGNQDVVASFLIQKDYNYENDFLVNSFNPLFEFPFLANINLDDTHQNAIYSANKKFIFALGIHPQQPTSTYYSYVLLSLFLFSIITFLWALYDLNSRIKPRYFFVIPLLVLLLRYVSLVGNWTWFLEQIPSFQPNLYASSEWFPHFGAYLINCAVICFLAMSFVQGLSFLKAGKWQRVLSLVLYLFSLVFSIFIAYLYQGLVENASIPLEIDKLFSLNFHSLLALISMGILFYAYFNWLRAVYLAMKRAGWKLTFMVVFWFLTSVLYFIYEITYGNQLLFLAVWPLLINGFIIFNVIKSNGVYRFSYGVLLLFLFAIYISVNLKEFYEIKEKAERELYANQLASDQDISTEVEYVGLKKKLLQDQLIQGLLHEGNSNKRAISSFSVSDFKQNLERNYFKKFWERYEIEFYLFDVKNQALLNYNDIPSSRYSTLEAIINRHSWMSEMDSSIYYIKDYTSQYSYLIRQEFKEDGKRAGTLYCTLKSKKIPEKIGFPRLLISSEAKVFQSLENYSIAKYYDHKLVSSNGKFAYPTQDNGLIRNLKGESGMVEIDGYNHFLLQKTSSDLIVLSRQKQTTIQLLTSFSYLFCFFGLFLLIPILIQSQQRHNYWKGLSLAVRIQLVLISLVFVALVAFGWGSGTFVKEQYQVYTNELIREKIKSLEIEISQRLGDEEKLSIFKQGSSMDLMLQKLANVFVTDINLYDKRGFMLASSRSKIYNLGLVSDQMDPDAFWGMRYSKKSEFIHEEIIGNLEYLSAYIPLYSNEGKLLAYLNLQHFGQQKGFEDQIQQFLVAIMNVFILLLGLSVVLAIFVSNWVTSPLRILQQNFASIQLGKYNKPIQYDSDDEIGTLVKDYNQKIEELEMAAKQLAQNERESAWREMAKQVAHEIKNPLTPMKLSLQHLQRIYDPTDPNSKQKIDRVAASIIEQIDALAKIANEFSNFAKMPRPNEENLDLVPLLENVILVFSQEATTEINFRTNEAHIWVLADKDLMIRVFNNLIKNALQSIPSGKTGKIEVILHTEKSTLHIQIKDNGRGIPEHLRKKMFVPYFTTKSNGTGLGLAMVKQIIEMHHGNIWYESEEDLGTTFFIEMPRIIRINN